MRKAPSLIAIAGIVWLAPLVHADLVTLTSGRTVKAENVAVGESKVTLELGFGAVMEVPIEIVERIVDDEIDPSDLDDLPLSPDPASGFRYNPERGPLFDSVWSEWIIHFAHEYDVDARLISAVIKAESDFDPRTVSSKGAIGLMQLMPATASRFGVDPWDPVENLRGGVRYLSWLLGEFDGSLDLVLAGYNAGEGNVRKYQGVPPFSETRNYVRRISGYLGS